MRESIFKGDVGSGPLVLQNKIFANDGGKRSLPSEGIAGIGGVIDKKGDDCCGERLGGGGCVEEGGRGDLLVRKGGDAITL